MTAAYKDVLQSLGVQCEAHKTIRFAAVCVSVIYFGGGDSIHKAEKLFFLFLFFGLGTVLHRQWLDTTRIGIVELDLLPSVRRNARQPIS